MTGRDLSDRAGSASRPALATGAEPRLIGPWQATAICAGNMMGVGIFLLPNQVAATTQRPGLFLLLWLVGGIWALTGALSLAELGAMLPRAGGDYVYLREAYGRPWAFMSGWLALLVTFPGSIAVMAYLTMRFQGPTVFGPWISATIFETGVGSWTLTATWSHLAAVVLIVALTWINHRSTRLSSRFQVLVTAVPIVILMVLASAAWSYFGEGATAAPTPVETPAVPPLAVVLLGLLPIYFAYAGWNAITYVAGEVREPGRRIPVALALGSILVTAVYLLVCVAYVQAVPVPAMTAELNLGVTVARALLGELAPRVVDSLIFVAVVGSINVTIMAGSRIYLAMARDGLFLSRATRLHSDYRTPTWSLWIQGLWAGVLVFVGTLEQLLDYTVTMMLVLSIMSVGAVVVLRRTRPDWERPYRTWLYPLTPLVYIAICVVVLWANLQKEGVAGQLVGIGIGIASLVVYRFAAGRGGTGSTPASTAAGAV